MIIIFQKLLLAMTLLYMSSLSAQAKQDSSSLEIVMDGYVWGRPATNPDTPLLISSEDSCKHEGLLSLGDGIGTCLRCGKGIIYDRELFERPLHVVGSQDSDGRAITGTGNFGFQPNAKLHVANGWITPATAKMDVVKTVQQTKRDSIHYNFLLDGKPADLYWKSLIDRFNIVEFDTVSIPTRKVWRRFSDRQTKILDAEETEGLMFQRLFVTVKDTNITDEDVMYWTELVRKKAPRKFKVVRTGAKRYRKWEILPSGLELDRGLHLGRADDVLKNARFRVNEDSIRDKLKKKAKEKVKIKTKR